MKKILETLFKILRIHFNKETAIPELFLNRVTNPSYNSNSEKSKIRRYLDFWKTYN